MTAVRPPLARRLARHLLTALGAWGLLGTGASAHAAVPAQRAALEARVAQARSHLAAPVQEGLVADEVASNSWNNWPNWSNWAKWANR